MEITRRMLEQKASEYREAAANHKANADANLGAAQAVERLIATLDAPAPEVKSNEGGPNT